MNSRRAGRKEAKPNWLELSIARWGRDSHESGFPVSRMTDRGEGRLSSATASSIKLSRSSRQAGLVERLSARRQAEIVFRLFDLVRTA